MSKKTALLNGRVYNPIRSTFEKTNILLIDQKIVGLGYIPDDDDSSHIDITEHYVLPNIFLPVITTDFPKNLPNQWIQNKAKQSGVTGFGLIPLSDTKDYGQLLSSFLACNQQSGINAIPLHITKPDSPQMIGLWHEDTDPIALETAIRFNKVIITAQRYQQLQPVMSQFAKAAWHIVVQHPDDITLFAQCKNNGTNVSLSIPHHFITEKSMSSLLPFIHNDTIQSISCDPPNWHQLFTIFPLLQQHLTITDIHNLYSANILKLYKLKLKGVAINHTPHLTVVNPKTGAVSYTVLNGKVQSATA